MKECIQSYYIIDGSLYCCETFDIGYLENGKSIYEVTRLIDSRPLFLEDHIDRLFNSFALEGLDPLINREVITGQLEDLIEKNRAREGNIKFLVNFNADNSSHFIAYFTAHKYPLPQDYINGIKVITYPFERHEPNKKIWRPDFRRKVADAIRVNNAWEAFLIDSRGYIPEASRSNIFVVKNEGVITPPEEFILSGITRKYVLDACRDLDIPVEFRLLSLDEIQEFDAIFMTSTSLHVIPVRQVDDIVLKTQDQVVTNIMKQFKETINKHLSIT